MSQVYVLVVLGAVLAVLGLLAAVALRRRFPVAWWLVFGWPALWWRIRRTWRDLAIECDLSTSRRPDVALVGDVVVRGRALERVYPRLSVGLPRHGRVRIRVRLLPGQTPDDYTAASEAFEHAWRVHAVRVFSPARGWVDLTALVHDPLHDPIAPGNTAAPSLVAGTPVRQRQDWRAQTWADSGWVREVLRASVGGREDGLPWVLDFLLIPHWLVVGVTQSGKSTFLNALMVWMAPYPVALVGVDLKGGMSLMPYLPRLSALATTREAAADLLEYLAHLTETRMAECVTAGVSSVWDLPAEDQPVPVMVFVDEIAELSLPADRAGEPGTRALVALTRLAQLGASLGIHLVIAGQRVGSDLGKGVTLLRSQLPGRVCHRVADEETVKMTLADKSAEAVAAALAITEEERGVAITTGVPGGWMRARSALVTTEHARMVASQWSHMRQELPGLGETVPGLGGGDIPW
ncbi:FtsK/SpoIIIE domain-containing protein [Catenulispora rubra]|uniref:FtsK/SpoIIIE domain-containing protein n=1 Tax=Catenulispora rubra TaxID=280293 RepID=UPI002B2650B1|nr:FtsK/SpoIIIE domain-containing protein [Catenulispora rubra]